jgi:hypothetical protein
VSSDHIGLEHYLWIHRGEGSPGELLRHIQRHVLDRCPECRREWEALAGEEKADLWELFEREGREIGFEAAASPRPAGEPEQPSRYAAAFTAAARKVTSAATQLKLERNRARKDLAKLLALPAAERRAALRRSRKRFHSPAMAHLLVEEGRSRVRRSPGAALEVLELVHHAVDSLNAVQKATDAAAGGSLEDAQHLPLPSTQEDASVCTTNAPSEASSDRLFCWRRALRLLDRRRLASSPLSHRRCTIPTHHLARRFGTGPESPTYRFQRPAMGHEARRRSHKTPSNQLSPRGGESFPFPVDKQYPFRPAASRWTPDS